MVTIKDMLKPNSRGDLIAAIGVVIVLIGVVIGSVTEDLWFMVIPLAVCFASLIIGIKLGQLPRPEGRGL